MPEMLPRIRCVLFDFGGVLAEEGFREGLQAIARGNNLDQERFFKTAADTIYQCNYVTGSGNEAEYWQKLRESTGIRGENSQLRQEILSRFILRPAMIEIVRQLRTSGYRIGILSDQTDWLDLLDRKYHFSREFEKVFNSYHLGKSKRDPAIFTETAAALGLTPHDILFVDDNPANTNRAAVQGMHIHLFTTTDAFRAFLKSNNLLF